MLALSIRQPWAWAILHAGKDIENRVWPTRYRGPILIHAAKGIAGREYDEAVAAISTVKGLCEGVRWSRIPYPKHIERGGIVGRAELVDCVTASASPWFCGPYGFVLRNVQPLPFQAMPGRLGMFEVGLQDV